MAPASGSRIIADMTYATIKINSAILYSVRITLNFAIVLFYCRIEEKDTVSRSGNNTVIKDRFIQRPTIYAAFLHPTLYVK